MANINSLTKDIKAELLKYIEQLSFNKQEFNSAAVNIKLEVLFLKMTDSLRRELSIISMKF